MQRSQETAARPARAGRAPVARDCNFYRCLVVKEHPAPEGPVLPSLASLMPLAGEGFMFFTPSGGPGKGAAGYFSEGPNAYGHPNHPHGTWAVDTAGSTGSSPGSADRAPTICSPPGRTSPGVTPARSGPERPERTQATWPPKGAPRRSPALRRSSGSSLGPEQTLAAPPTVPPGRCCASL